MAKTNDLPRVEGEGVAPKRHPALDSAIEEWRDFAVKRMALTEKEAAARDKVVTMMHQRNLTVYPYDDGGDDRRNVVLEGAEKLKLQKVKDAPAPKAEPAAEQD
jgi:hypothetical protein